MTTVGIDAESCQSINTSDNNGSTDFVSNGSNPDSDSPDESHVEEAIMSDDDDIDGSDGDDNPDQSNEEIMSDDLKDEKKPKIRYQYAYDPSESTAMHPLFFPFGESSNQREHHDNSTKSNIERKQRVENATFKLRQLFKKYATTDGLPPLNPDDWKGEGGPSWEIDPSSPWYDVPAALDEIVEVREELKKAWNTYHGSDQDEIDGENMKEGRNNYDERGRKTAGEQSWKTRADSSTKTDKDNEPMTMNEWHIQFHKEQEEKRYRQQNPPLTKDEQEKFKQFHMEWVTDAFAEELNALRKGRLEKMFGNKSKKDAHGNNPLELELDPTQHSFVVPNGNARIEENDQSDKAAEEAAAAEVDVRVLADMLMSGGNFLTDVEKRMLVNARLRGQTNNGGNTRVEKMSLHERRRRELGFGE
mmetsp:Transcript_1585/g.3231  ORF Transcript_1585/g.3231 Transcript_1585/m.3231 type:complete len:417 (-) Transcript_1585:132-1382(-)